MSLRLSPLLTHDGDKLDAVIELSTNNVRTFHQTRILAPREVGPGEAKIDVPEVSETRINQTVRDWSLGQTLVISTGFSPGSTSRRGACSTSASRGRRRRATSCSCSSTSTPRPTTRPLRLASRLSGIGRGDEAGRGRAGGWFRVRGVARVGSAGYNFRGGPSTSPVPAPKANDPMRSPHPRPGGRPPRIGARPILDRRQPVFRAGGPVQHEPAELHRPLCLLYSAGPKICHDLGFDDDQFGALTISFMVVYTIISPLVGFVGDRYNRKRILAFGVALWSLATIGTSFARGFGDMFLWRALLGIGEASYGIIAPALLADLFAPRHRGRVMGVYYLALPVGRGDRLPVGGHFAHAGDWRAAFWVVGIPGLAAAVAGLILRDPGRGASEGQRATADTSASRPGRREYLAILRTPSFLLNTAGQAAVTFAIGAYGVWGATFYHRVRGMDLASAGKQIGVLTAVAGLVGIGLGTVAADLLRRLTRARVPDLAVPRRGGRRAVRDDGDPGADGVAVVDLPVRRVADDGLGARPSNTVTANVVPAAHRAAGFALSIFLVHLFGDISSPWLIGKVSSLLGAPGVTHSPIGRSSSRSAPRRRPTPRGTWRT